MAEIKIANYNVNIPALSGQSILISLLNEGQPVHTICGGKAQCGCCRVKILQGSEKLSPVRPGEKARLGEVKLEDGWRLACQTHNLRDVTLHLPTAKELESHCLKK